MSPTDSLFLLGESRDHPMHVGGLFIPHEIHFRLINSFDSFDNRHCELPFTGMHGGQLVRPTHIYCFGHH
ncbi:hypothetical protein EP51_44635 (plasmid) [Rhodococcus opacus]|uniref:Diacylglycerol O-acyltransferase n=1 Tax=Rhodococcus opacus TaxID=37919 RepID=A0A076F630_RHOOP|nr:hypothetical protein EP51_44635 [Rhodococcus opacus]